jgi:hypothetical protein
MAANTPTGTVTTTLTAPSLGFPVSSGVPYVFKYRIPWNTGQAPCGLKLGVTFPAFISCSVRVSVGVTAPGTAVFQEGMIHTSGTFVIGASAATLANNVAEIDGEIYCSGTGALNVIYGAEVATASGVRLMAGGSGIIWALA